MKNFKRILKGLMLSLIFTQFLCGCGLNSNENRLDSLYEYLIIEFKIGRLCETQTPMDWFEFGPLKSEFEEYDFDEYQNQSVKMFDSNQFTDVNIITKKETDSLVDDANLLREKNAFFEIYKPLFNSDSSRVIVQLNFQCGRYCSFTKLNQYEYQNGEWRLEDELSETTW